MKNCYCFIIILLFLNSCSSDKRQVNSEARGLEFDEIFGNYVNVKNSDDTLKILTSNKFQNIIYENNKLVLFFEGEFTIVKKNNREVNFSFCYMRKFGNDKEFQNCCEIIKENGKLKLSYETKNYEK